MKKFPLLAYMLAVLISIIYIISLCMLIQVLNSDNDASRTTVIWNIFLILINSITTYVAIYYAHHVYQVENAPDTEYNFSCFDSFISIILLVPINFNAWYPRELQHHNAFFYFSVIASVLMMLILLVDQCGKNYIKLRPKSDPFAYQNMV
jgi:hypothetical protein